MSQGKSALFRVLLGLPAWRIEYNKKRHLFADFT